MTRRTAHPFRPLATLAAAEQRVQARRRLEPLGLPLADRLWPHKVSPFGPQHPARLRRIILTSLANARPRSELEP